MSWQAVSVAVFGPLVPAIVLYYGVMYVIGQIRWSFGGHS